MYQRFLQTAARNALAAGDIQIYKRAFDLAVANLGSVQAVRNLKMPTPEALSWEMKTPLAFALHMAELCLGLWLVEWAKDNPTQTSAITWEYWPEFSRAVFERHAFGL